jgi:hypothetical protein
MSYDVYCTVLVMMSAVRSESKLIRGTMRKTSVSGKANKCKFVYENLGLLSGVCGWNPSGLLPKKSRHLVSIIHILNSDSLNNL